MNTPSLSFTFFLIACAMGAGLGIFYDFLRPLRPKYTALSDLAFVIGTAYSWLWLSFGICRGDIRIGYWAGLLVGGFFWEYTLGRPLLPLFTTFWQIAAIPLGFVKNIFKKTGKKQKTSLHPKKNRVQ